jgi:hypothetical protein
MLLMQNGTVEYIRVSRQQINNSMSKVAAAIL